MNIKKRAAAMEAEAAKEIARAKAAEAKRKKELREAIDFAVISILSLIIFGLVVWGGIYFYLHCNKYGCH